MGCLDADQAHHHGYRWHDFLLGAVRRWVCACMCTCVWGGPIHMRCLNAGQFGPDVGHRLVQGVLGVPHR